MSRANAVRFSHQPHDYPSIMISISDPYMLYHSKPTANNRTNKNGIREILRLEFADADKPGLDVYGRPSDENDLISAMDAVKIHQLLNRHPDVDAIIVHCDAGISRSAGVAAAILYAKTGDDSLIFDSGRYAPNMRCYRMVLNELMMGDAEHPLTTGGDSK
jgi:predicted protein tyrosine phosphatase